MSLEAIKQVTETEENIQTHKAAAEAEARQIVADAEKAGQALVKQMRSKAAEQGKELLRQAEERAAIRAKEIEAGAEAESFRKKCGVYEKAGLLRIADGRMRMTPKGFLVSNQLLAELLDF